MGERAVHALKALVSAFYKPSKQCSLTFTGPARPLQVVCAGPVLRQHNVCHDVAGAVLPLLSLGQSNRQGKEEALQALEALLAACPDDVIEAGALPVLVKMLNNKDQGKQHMGAGLLHTLAGASDAHKTAVVEQAGDSPLQLCQDLSCLLMDT